jgi:hypothetical protein
MTAHRHTAARCPEYRCPRGEMPGDHTQPPGLPASAPRSSGPPSSGPPSSGPPSSGPPSSGLPPHTGGHDWAVALGLTAGSLTALRIDPAPGCVRAARHFLRTALRRWRLTPYADDAAAVAAELVTNALQHALPRPCPPRRVPRPAAWLTLTRKEHALLCAVSDPSPDPPVLGAADPLADGGRGLYVVAALSASWGWSPGSGPGKTVWARIPTPPGAYPGRTG